MEKRKYDSSVARMAGNIAAGLATSPLEDLNDEHNRQELAILAVDIARRIVDLLAEPTT